MSRRIAPGEGPTPSFTLRLPAAMAAEVDAVRTDLEACVGIPVSRGDTLRVLVKEALAARMSASQAFIPAPPMQRSHPVPALRVGSQSASVSQSASGPRQRSGSQSESGSQSASVSQSASGPRTSSTSQTPSGDRVSRSRSVKRSRDESTSQSGPRALAGPGDVAALAAALRGEVNVNLLARNTGLARSRLFALTRRARKGEALGAVEQRTVRLVLEALAPARDGAGTE